MLADVTVALLQTAFTVDEEQAPVDVTICTVLIGFAQREVIVTLSTLNGTAQGR